MTSHALVAGMGLAGGTAALCVCSAVTDDLPKGVTSAAQSAGAYDSTGAYLGRAGGYTEGEHART